MEWRLTALQLQRYKTSGWMVPLLFLVLMFWKGRHWTNLGQSKGLDFGGLCWYIKDVWYGLAQDAGGFRKMHARASCSDFASSSRTDPTPIVTPTSGRILKDTAVSLFDGYVASTCSGLH